MLTALVKTSPPNTPTLKSKMKAIPAVGIATIAKNAIIVLTAKIATIAILVKTAIRAALVIIVIIVAGVSVVTRAQIAKT